MCTERKAAWGSHHTFFLSPTIKAEAEIPDTRSAGCLWALSVGVESCEASGDTYEKSGRYDEA